MSQMIAHPGSWWADPSVQWDRDAFRAAVAMQTIRWRDNDARIKQVMAGLQTQDWMTAGGKRRSLSGYSVVMS